MSSSTSNSDPAASDRRPSDEASSGEPPSGEPPSGQSPLDQAGRWQRFFRLAAGSSAAFAAVIYAFVVLVDPFDTLPLSPPWDRAPVTSNQRFSYPALARSTRFD